MSKKEKKIERLKDRIQELKDEMFTNLKQKTSDTPEISISEYQTKILALEKQLQMLL